MTERFQVDLGGVVELLSGALYSGPQVFVRELLQNGIDAVTARARVDPGAPAQIRLRLAGFAARPELTVTDTGVGLTAEQARLLLATIGRSSKRESADIFDRSDFIGQFGVGLLATFLVSDDVEVISRAAAPAAVPMRWVGRSDGTFQVEECPDSDHPIGTTVRLRARAGCEHWFTQESIAALVSDYGELLDCDVSLQVEVTGNDPREARRRLTLRELPWRARYDSAAEREHALRDYGERLFGFSPLAVIDLDVPLIGTSGVAFVLPRSIGTASVGHRLSVKRMLVGAKVDGILPEWAFFVRAVVDSDRLSPTASREQVRSDEALITVREALAGQIKSWVTSLLESRDRRAAEFLKVHHLALRAWAATDDDLLDLVATTLPYETTAGTMTLREAIGDGELLFATSLESYRRVASVARAQSLTVVNAGYVYDTDIIRRLETQRRWKARELRANDQLGSLRHVGADREAATAEAMAAARTVMAAEECDVVFRDFDPAGVPCVLLRDAEGERDRDLHREASEAQGVWSGLLDVFAEPRSTLTRTLVLNDSSDVVGDLLRSPESAVFEAGLRTIYFSAVLQAGDGLNPRERRTMNEAMATLLRASLAGQPVWSKEENRDVD